MVKSSDAALGRRALSVVLSSVWTRTYSCLALRRCNWPICTGLMQIRFRQSPLTLGQQLLGNRCSWTGTGSDLGSSHTGNSCCSLLFIFILAWKCQLVENKSLIRNTIWGAVKNKNPQLLNLLRQPTEWSVTSHYHGSKIYRSQQSFFTETAIVKRRKKNMGHHFVLSAIMLRKVIRISFFFLFSDIHVFAEPRFAEIQIFSYHVKVTWQLILSIYRTSSVHKGHRIANYIFL